MDTSTYKKERRRFFMGNMLRGGLWLLIILGFFILLEVLEFDYYALMGRFYDRPLVLFLIYSFSETFFGIIPPELFMIWARGYQNIIQYVEIVSLLAVISYIAGIIGYFAGRYFGDLPFYQKIKRYKLNRVIPLVQKYGFLLVIIAALTPVPFSATCMVVGSLRFPFRKFLFFSAFRFLRFVLYAYIVWHATL